MSEEKSAYITRAELEARITAFTQCVKDWHYQEIESRLRAFFEPYAHLDKEVQSCVTVDQLEQRLASFVRDVRTPCPLPHWNPEREVTVNKQRLAMLEEKARLWDHAHAGGDRFVHLLKKEHDTLKEKAEAYDKVGYLFDESAGGKIKADAELGRLVRQMRAGSELWHTTTLGSVKEPSWTVVNEQGSHLAHGKTPEEALRAALGETE